MSTHSASHGGGEGGRGEEGYQWLFDILDDLPMSAQPRAMAQGTAAVAAMHERRSPARAYPSPPMRHRPMAQTEGWGWFVEEDDDDADAED